MTNEGQADDIPAVDVRIHGFFNDRGSTQMQELLQEFYGVTEIEPHEIFLKGIYLAQDSNTFSNNVEREDGLFLTDKEQRALDLDREPVRSFKRQRRLRPQTQTNSIRKYRELPWPLWKLILLCAIGATVQGWDEAAINGAQIWYQAAFQIFIDTSSIPDELLVPPNPLKPRPNIVGLVNGAPYLCCVVSCWFTPWLNSKLGRRGTIFWCALFSAAFAFAQGWAQTWQELLIYRLLMGLGIGPKSATVPIYAAECAPANIRGSLVMFWQVWTAFGIAAGSVAGVVLQNLGNAGHIGQDGTALCPRYDSLQLRSWRCSENWRLILASPSILPCFLALYIYGCWESPRWTIARAHTLRRKGRSERARIFYRKAFKGLGEMSRDRILAARDMISHYYLLQKERDEVVSQQDTNRPSRSWFLRELHELFFSRRNSRAIIASTVCMFAQQFWDEHGIQNTINSVSPAALALATRRALLFTMCFGLVNLLFAIPAFFTIDTIGRRTLLLITFPLLAMSHLITTFGAQYKDAVALVGILLFDIFYSPGEGPVPFVYAAESMPLQIREKGMAFVTSINWLFNFVIAFTGPLLLTVSNGNSWPPFAWYTVWCVILWFAILLLVPETRLLTLEELDFVFREVTAWEFANHSFKEFLWNIYLRVERPNRIWDQPEKEERERRMQQQRRTSDDLGLPNGDVNHENVTAATKEQ